MGIVNARTVAGKVRLSRTYLKNLRMNKMTTIDDAEKVMADALALMRKKNADYGDSWRLMRLTSITDQILVKVQRIRTLEESMTAPQVSEGIESEYRDILNYCVFALIMIRESWEGYDAEYLYEMQEEHEKSLSEYPE